MSSVLGTNLSPVVQSPRGRGGLPYAIIEPLFALTDSALILGTSILGGVAYQLAATGGFGDVASYAGLGLVACVTYALAGYHLDIYRLSSLLQRQRGYVRVLTSWLIAVLAVTVVLFLFKIGAQVSRGSAVCAALLGGSTLVGWRGIAKRRLRRTLARGAILGRRALLVGTPDELAHVGPSDLLLSFGADEVERVTLPGFADRTTMSSIQHAAVKRALERSRATRLDEVLLAIPWANMAQLDLLMTQFRVSPLPIRLLPDRSVSAVLRRQTLVAPQSFVVEIQRAPLSAVERGVKRGLDIVVATVSLAVLVPVMAVTAVAIKLESPGPVIFRQYRHGFNGRQFRIFKFRTMTVMEDGASVAQARRHDPRVTRVGRILRTTSIDELPQIVNVLRGDMSIVGPRPHAVAHDDEYGKIIANYAFRHHVKPGITGWAQVNGYRGETPHLDLMKKRISLDLWYINNWTVGLDLKIILKTAFELLRHRNAY